MRRLRPAESLTVIFESQRPKAFVFHGQRYAVERATGPWRTEGEWWNATRWGCEQWDLTARAQDGATLCCCLVRDLLREQWQMAGVYD